MLLTKKVGDEQYWTPCILTLRGCLMEKLGVSSKHKKGGLRGCPCSFGLHYISLLPAQLTQNASSSTILETISQGQDNKNRSPVPVILLGSIGCHQLS